MTRRPFLNLALLAAAMVAIWLLAEWRFTP